MMRQKWQKQNSQTSDPGRLLARPVQTTSTTGTALFGLQPLELGSERDGFLYIPSRYKAEQPMPLVLMLHGAGGDGRGGLVPFLDLADAVGPILLAPDSRQQTWDVIRSQYGPDTAFINRALEQTFDRYAIDPKHVAIEGFSDGASYALSVGITNGDLFTHVIAFSPGFIAPADQRGLPPLFISHGTRDTVLPIDRCSRRIVPQVERAGYDVLYHEFDGSHIVPAAIAREALNWFIT